MNFLRTMYQTVLDALFPLTNEEREILTMSPEGAFEKLPRAPAYDEPMPNMVSIFAYKDERVAKLVWNIKYKKSETAVRIGGYALWRKLMEMYGATQNNSLLRTKSVDLLADFESGLTRTNTNWPILVIPLPITDRRRKERGYNQTELLVDEIARLDVEKHFTVSKDLLVRTKHVARQTLKGRKERLESSEGIFAVNEKAIEQYDNKTIAQLKDSRVVIIDDVITTGSTMKEAITAMQTAGFTNVTGISLAH